MNWAGRLSFASIKAGFPNATASLLFNDKRQTCSHNGKTLKVVLSSAIYPLRDKQVIASSLGQLRINFKCTFKVFQIALIASWLVQFCGNFRKIRVKLVLNCPRAHAITYTNKTLSNLIFFTCFAKLTTAWNYFINRWKTCLNEF